MIADSSYGRKLVTDAFILLRQYAYAEEEVRLMEAEALKGVTCAAPLNEMPCKGCSRGADYAPCKFCVQHATSWSEPLEGCGTRSFEDGREMSSGGVRIRVGS